MAKKGIGDTTIAPPAKAAAKRKTKPAAESSGARDPRGQGPRKLPDAEVAKRRVLFLNDVYYSALKARAQAEGDRRGERVSPSEIVRLALAEYLEL